MSNSNVTKISWYVTEDRTKGWWKNKRKGSKEGETDKEMREREREKEGEK